MVTLEQGSEAFLKNIFDTAVDGIVVIDSTGQILLTNPAAALLFGYSAREMTGKNVSMLMANPHQEQHDGYLNRYLLTGEARIIGIGREVEGRRKDGTLFPFRLSISEVRLDDGRRIFTGIVHDISAIKMAERELRELNQELERKVRERTEDLSKAVNRLLVTNSNLEHEVRERKRTEQKLLQIQGELEQGLEREKELGELKSRFLTLASHEFRTPLTAILSSASLIARYTDEKSQPKRQRHIDRIHGAVRNLTGLLEDFLSVGRLQEGRVQPKFEPTELVSCLAEWTREFQESVWKEGEVRFACPQELPVLNLDTDPRIVQNMLLNLLSNAVKYSTEPIAVQVQLEAQPGFVLIHVRDRGIGIPEREQEHLADRFFRASNAVNIQGTGLGLHIVREYAELLGGTLTFVSQLGEGSVFSIRLPLQRSDRSPLPPSFSENI
jgi:two-component system sensor kinase FixL